MRLAARGDAAAALLGSLTVDDRATRLNLGWRPRFSLDEGLAATCRWFAEQRA
jgi:nucleoside-diphosphate-sugar epimerase